MQKAANSDITINTKFGNWNYFEGGGFGARMPWWTNLTTEGIITTSQSGTNYWWGTLIPAAAGTLPHGYPATEERYQCKGPVLSGIG